MGMNEGSLSGKAPTGEVGSSPTPRKFLQVRWNESVGLPECPYLRRWVFYFGFFAIRIHRWEASDDLRAFHDHAWWFITCVLKGSYTDVSPEGMETLRAGSVRFRRAEYRHTVNVNVPGTWTVLITGRPTRRWAFYPEGKMLKRDKYFAKYGHHPCNEGEAPIRITPEGRRI